MFINWIQNLYQIFGYICVRPVNTLQYLHTVELCQLLFGERVHHWQFLDIHTTNTSWRINHAKINLPTELITLK